MLGRQRKSWYKWINQPHFSKTSHMKPDCQARSDTVGYVKQSLIVNKSCHWLLPYQIARKYRFLCIFGTRYTK